MRNFRGSFRIDFYGLIRVAAAIGLAFGIATVIIMIVAKTPQAALRNFFLGAFSTRRNFSKTLEDMIPLVFTGLSLNVMHKSGLFSMSADSSFYLAGVSAALIAILLPAPPFVHQGIILLSGILVGGLASLVPVICKKYSGTHELVISLMMNYITYNAGYYLIRATCIDTTNGSFSISFLPTATLGKMFRGTNVHWGMAIMILAVLCVYLIMDRSRFGRELRITGSNEHFARYAGIPVASVVILSQFAGGALAGLGGAVTMIGVFSRFQWILPQNYVWDGILINLLAGTKPLLIPLSAFFISYIRVGANVMSRAGDVDSELVSIIQGIIILLIASERFLYQMRKRREEREALQNRQAGQNGRT
jgi:simple sugar transport system permease protein